MSTTTSIPTTTNSDLKSVHYCFKWLYLIMLHLGCLDVHLHNNQVSPTKSLRRLAVYIVRIALLVCFLGGVSYKLNNEQETRAMFDCISPVMKFIMIFEVGCCTSTFLEMAFKFDFKRQAYVQLALGMQRLDECMLRDFPQLLWNYHKTERKFTTLTVTVVSFYFSMALLYVFNIASCNCHLATTFLVAMTYACITTATGCTGALHVGQMDLLRLRYRLIERMVRQYTVKARFGEDEALKRICQLVKYCKSYTDLMLEVNNVFGFVCIVGLFYDFGILTNMAFLLCQRASASKAPPQDYVFIVLFMLPRIYKVGTTAMYGYMVEKEKRKCLHTLVTYANFFRRSSQLQEVQQLFLTWKMHHNFRLSIGQTIPCNLNVAFMVLHGVINYVIILIQLQFQQNNISSRLSLHDIPKDVEVFDPAKLSWNMK